jgi:hypothetical protein
MPDPVQSTGASPNGMRPDDMPGLPALAARLTAMTARYLEVVGHMEQTADSMRESGAPPEYHLLEALGDCHRQFLRMRHDVLRKAAMLGVKIRSTERLSTLRDIEAFLDTLSETPPPAVGSSSPSHTPHPMVVVEPATTTPPPPAEVVVAEPVPASPDSDPPRHHDAMTSPEPWSVATVVSSPSEAVAAEQSVEPVAPRDAASSAPTAGLEPAFADDPAGRDEVVQAALAVLEKASRMSTHDGTELPALLEYHDEVRRLREVVEARSPGEWHPIAERLASGKHPVAMLANAVEGKDALSDSDWADLHAMVTDTFGRPLAVALARHRLVVAPPRST